MDTMMTKHISFWSVAVLFVALVFASCQNQVDGCTDPAALNYNPNATQDDGSCQYASVNNEAGITFWFTQTTAYSYIDNDSITSFKFIVGGVVEGTHYLTQVDATAPACNAANHVTVKRTVPQSTVQFIPYVMEDQNGDTVITGSFQFLGGSCYAVEITY